MWTAVVVGFLEDVGVGQTEWTWASHTSACLPLNTIPLTDAIAEKEKPACISEHD